MRAPCRALRLGRACSSGALPSPLAHYERRDSTRSFPPSVIPHNPTMYRCVVLHRNGTSELEEVQPALHQKLRHLEYKRFVVEFVRDSDGISVTAPLYCQFSPSSWQASNAAKQLWGRQSGTVRLFDEDGHLVQDAMAAGGTPFQGSEVIRNESTAGTPTSTATLSGADGEVRFTREDV